MTSYGWQERAACIGVSSMTSDHKERRAAAAERYCATCPVLDACAAAGDELGATFGVWGGRDRGTCVECGGRISLAHARPDGCCGAQCGQSWKNQRSCQVCGVRLRRRQSRACGNLCAGRLRARERKAVVA